MAVFVGSGWCMTEFLREGQPYYTWASWCAQLTINGVACTTVQCLNNITLHRARREFQPQVHKRDKSTWPMMRGLWIPSSEPKEASRTRSFVFGLVSTLRLQNMRPLMWWIMLLSCISAVWPRSGQLLQLWPLHVLGSSMIAFRSAATNLLGAAWEAREHYHIQDSCY